MLSLPITLFALVALLLQTSLAFVLPPGMNFTVPACNHSLLDIPCAPILPDLPSHMDLKNTTAAGGLAVELREKPGLSVNLSVANGSEFHFTQSGIAKFGHDLAEGVVGGRSGNSTANITLPAFANMTLSSSANLTERRVPVIFGIPPANVTIPPLP